MCGADDARERTPTAGEIRAAELLTRALDGCEPAGVDMDALRAARLLQALAPDVDDVSRRRLRSQLVADAALRPRRLMARRRLAVAATAAALLVCVLVLRQGTHPTRQMLMEREREAGLAVAAVAHGWSRDAAVDERFASLFDQQWRDRLDARVESGRSSLITAEYEATRAAGPVTKPAHSGGTS